MDMDMDNLREDFNDEIEDTYPSEMDMYNLPEDFKDEVEDTYPKMDKVDYYKIRKFFVKDILQSKSESRYFVIGNVYFLYIQVYGVILSKERHKAKISLDVHDGSGSLTCLFEENYFKKHPQKSTDIPPFPEEYNPLIQAIHITASSYKYLEQSLPKTLDDLKIGDTVCIEGKLKKRNEVLYLFIEKINRKTMNDFVNNLSAVQTV